MEKEGFYLKFQLKEKYIELFKLLKVLDLVDSGAEAKLLIENKHVTRNKELETRKRAKIVAGDIIEIADITIEVL
jgi:ribosome-associated protein